MYQNLLMNKNRLSTPFDIHQTLHDIIQFPEDLTSEQVSLILMYQNCKFTTRFLSDFCRLDSCHLKCIILGRKRPLDLPAPSYSRI